jgi:UDP:flavonoid glycosyltransferase YjiC (YdhE family)
MVDYDVLIISDFRFPGGTSSCIAEEMLALKRYGYTLGLIQVYGHTRLVKFSINSKIIEQAQSESIEFIDFEDEQPIKTKLLLLHHPNVFEAPFEIPRQIIADKIFLIVHQPPVDESRVYYNTDFVNNSIVASFGQKPIWSPVGPTIRDVLTKYLEPELLWQEDWVNVIDVVAWEQGERENWRSNIPIIGRHSRPSTLKWPDTLNDVVSVYPIDGSMKVRVLGGCPIIPTILPSKPLSWDVLEFNEIHPRDFLHTIDFFVYFHSPQWIEAFGRTILEAVACGAISILPPHFQKVFGESAIYCQLEEVQEKVWQIYRHPDLAQQHRVNAIKFLRQTYGLEAYASRINKLIGKPTPRKTTEILVEEQTKNVIFFSSNGNGMGHLTRIMSVAKRTSGKIKPIILTTSKAIKWVKETGFFVEYLPDPRDIMDGSGKHGKWNDFLYRRLTDIVNFYNVHAVVFDGNYPYQGLIDACTDLKVMSFWIRRGMWKKGKGGEIIAQQKYFDFTIQPTEFAEAVDLGMTNADCDRVLKVPPIVFLDTQELLEKEQAKIELGLDLSKKSVFIQLGSGNYVDVTPSYKYSIECLRKYPNVEIVLGKTPLNLNEFAFDRDIKIIEKYPISKYFKAFDFIISATGYNVFHECMLFGIPALFLPIITSFTPNTLEDTAPRAKYAESLGLAIHAEINDQTAIELAIKDMLAGKAIAIREKLRQEKPFTNGGVKASQFIEKCVIQGRKAFDKSLQYIDGKDTFVLYRILGNDLPPRHKQGQVLENLKFILDYESEFENCQKRWIVNRITNYEQEKSVINLLKEHAQEYIHIPFIKEDYAAIDLDYEGFPEPDFFNSETYHKLGPVAKEYALNFTYRHKNIYVMNNNGARNVALKDGLRRAKWVLPWDGNCFVTRGAWKLIVEGIKTLKDEKYIIVPMTRVLNNIDLLNPEFIPNPLEEPQIIFRCDAKEEFNEQMQYGRIPKIQLLWRLGVPGKWDDWKLQPWEKYDKSLCREAGLFKHSAWVARLSSGKQDQEKDSDLRNNLRNQAIRSFLDNLI